jgi:hypothetical protein
MTPAKHALLEAMDIQGLHDVGTAQDETRVTWLVSCLTESLRDCMHQFDVACIDVNGHALCVLSASFTGQTREK